MHKQKIKYIQVSSNSDARNWSILLTVVSILPSHEGFEFVGELTQDFQEMPLVEPTDSLLKKMLANGIDGLLLQVVNLLDIDRWLLCNGCI